jgi:hypothetical protein
MQPNPLHPPPFVASDVSPRPVRLSSETVEEFIGWVAATPVGDAQRIRDQVALAAADEGTFDALIKELFKFPVADFGRHLLLLSVIGELKNSRAVEPLLRFIRLPAESLPLLRKVPEAGKENDVSLLEGSAALQARAVEMLAFLRSPQALEETLRIASEHTSTSVRAAAIDAYLFNHDDSHEATEQIIRIALLKDAHLVGLPRRSRNMDADVFNAKVASYYRNHPQEHPPIPGRIERIPKKGPSEKRPQPDRI